MNDEMRAPETMTQHERLDALVRWFAAESPEAGESDIPPDDEGRWQLLRGLMNVRPPAAVPGFILAMQDAFLTARMAEKGIVRWTDIPTAAEQYGSRHPQADRLAVWQGDITRLAADAIVNAANARMLGCFYPNHPCIDNCIHTEAGVQLRAACHRQMQRLRRRHGAAYEQPTAVPMLTAGYNLPARTVVHIVGPIVSGALSPKHESALEACYRRTLDLCLAHGLRSVAFCCISTGVFHFPDQRAAEIAVAAVSDWLAVHPAAVERVIFNVFKDADMAHYERLLSGVPL